MIVAQASKTDSPAVVTLGAMRHANSSPEALARENAARIAAVLYTDV